MSGKVPESAVEAIKARWFDAAQEFGGDDHKVAQALGEAAAPHFEQEFRERLLSDEVVEAVARNRFERRREGGERGWDELPDSERRRGLLHEAKSDLQAALATIEKGGEG